MGGRGSASGISQGSKFSYRTEGSAGSHQKEADQIISSMKSVLSDFGMESALTSIYYSSGNRASAGADGFGGVTISKQYLQNGNGKNDGYFTSNTFAGTGAHEAGHLVSNQLLKTKVIPNASNLEKATARQKNKLDKAIIKEASKRYGSNPSISKYGSSNAAEKVAEAVSDVYVNKRNSNPYSKEIVSVMKDINSGNFKPKIK